MLFWLTVVTASKLRNPAAAARDCGSSAAAAAAWGVVSSVAVVCATWDSLSPATVWLTAHLWMPSSAAVRARRLHGGEGDEQRQRGAHHEDSPGPRADPEQELVGHAISPVEMRAVPVRAARWCADTSTASDAHAAVLPSAAAAAHPPRGARQGRASWRDVVSLL